MTAAAPTSGWSENQLSSVGRADEVEIASYRPDGTLRPLIPIWGVRVGDELYVRSAYGRDNGWFRRALASGTGHIRAGAVDADVDFTEVPADSGIHRDIDAEYHTKYDRYGPRIVGSVVGATAAAATFLLTPRH